MRWLNAAQASPEYPTCVKSSSRDNGVLKLWITTERISHARRPDGSCQSRSNKSARPRARAAFYPLDFPVVGIGASAGGLDACRKFLAALPADSGMAFILIQHLDPTHESMMVDLLAGHTPMTVVQATDGMPFERDHLYVIPPGTYLSVVDGALRLSHPQARHGARLPFDFLLQSMAAACGTRAICVVLSGTGADGSLGLGQREAKRRPGDRAGPRRGRLWRHATKRHHDRRRGSRAVGGQNSRAARKDRHRTCGCAERGTCAGYDQALVARDHRSFSCQDSPRFHALQARHATTPDRAPRGDGTVDIRDVDRYIQILRSDPDEFHLLAKDLLINVTSFFRDPSVFDLLAAKIIPDLVRSHAPDTPMRIWVAGCSTGEETYSLAMLFREEITAANLGIKLQVFASDVDSEAIASAREGLYPASIEADVSADRLARFFSKEENNYRVSPELRAAVVFTVQDVLADPPFSRLDFVSCRNLLIYLRPEAQAKVVALFHFALREGGILLLGTSETVGADDGLFEIVSKSERLYRHIGHQPAGGIRLYPRHRRRRARARSTGPGRRTPTPGCPGGAVSAHGDGDLRTGGGSDQPKARMPLFAGSDRPLPARRARTPSHDLLAMARQGVRTKLRSAIQQASQEHAAHRYHRRPDQRDGQSGTFSIAVQPFRSEGEELLLICFVDDPKAGADPGQIGHRARCSAGRRTGTGTGGYANRASGRYPQSGDFGRRAEGDQ